MPAHSYLKPQIFPKGAAMLVTKEIIAKMKNIVIIATVRPPEELLPPKFYSWLIIKF